MILQVRSTIPAALIPVRTEACAWPQIITRTTHVTARVLASVTMERTVKYVSKVVQSGSNLST